MYKPTLYYKRTPQQRADKFLSWNRDDTSFFAAGACHILAYQFMELHSINKKYNIIGLKSVHDTNVHNVFVSDGTWAFDYAGWTLEDELLAETKMAHTAVNKDWEYEKVLITEDLETFCKQYNHRAPAHFAYLPWERAYKYIKMFDPRPPEL